MAGKGIEWKERGKEGKKYIISKRLRGREEEEREKRTKGREEERKGEGRRGKKGKKYNISKRLREERSGIGPDN